MAGAVADGGAAVASPAEDGGCYPCVRAARPAAGLALDGLPTPPSHGHPTLTAWGITPASVGAALRRRVTAVRLRGDVTTLQQSSVAVVEVEVATEAGTAGAVTLLAKHADVGALAASNPGKSAAKWAVSLRSYDNEAAFLTVGAAFIDAVRAAGCVIPAPVAVTAVEGGTVAARYTTLLEYLPSPPYYQRVTLDVDHAAAALTALARFHAAAWDADACTDAAGTRALRRALFPAGGWWRCELRPGVDFAATPAVFRAMCAAFPAHFAGVDTPPCHAAFDWLGAHAAAVSAAVHAPPRTLVHGDAKAANWFFRAAAGGAPPVPALIDFQWTGGAASGCGDVVYVVAGAVEAAALQAAAPALVETYWRALTAALPPGATYRRAEFERDMALELLDYATTALPYLHAGWTPAAAAAHRGEFGWLVHETEPAAAAWLCGCVARTAAAAAAAAATTAADLAAVAFPPFWCAADTT